MPFVRYSVETSSQPAIPCDPINEDLLKSNDRRHHDSLYKRSDVPGEALARRSEFNKCQLPWSNANVSCSSISPSDQCLCPSRHSSSTAGGAISPSKTSDATPLPSQNSLSSRVSHCTHTNRSHQSLIWTAIVEGVVDGGGGGGGRVVYVVW